MTDAQQLAIQTNDPTLTSVNLKNVQDINIVQFSNSLITNTCITDLEMSIYEDVSDGGVAVLTNMLRINTSLDNFKLVYGRLGEKAEFELVTAAAERIQQLRFHKCGNLAAMETGTVARALAALIPNNTTLVKLVVGGDYEVMAAESQDLLMEALKHNTTLKVRVILSCLLV